MDEEVQAPVRRPPQPPQRPSAGGTVRMSTEAKRSLLNPVYSTPNFNHEGSPVASPNSVEVSPRRQNQSFLAAIPEPLYAAQPPAASAETSPTAKPRPGILPKGSTPRHFQRASTTTGATSPQSGVPPTRVSRTVSPSPGSSGTVPRTQPERPARASSSTEKLGSSPKTTGSAVPSTSSFAMADSNISKATPGTFIFNEGDDDKKAKGAASSTQSKGKVHYIDSDMKMQYASMPPLEFAGAEKRELRDVLTSVTRRNIFSKWIRMSHAEVKLNSYIRAAMRLSGHEHVYKIKRISFDRYIRTNGLLYFLDCIDRATEESMHIWLLIRLVTISGKEIQLAETPEKHIIQVHDWHCKLCKAGKECNHKYKAVQQLTDFTFGLHIKMTHDTKGEPVYLYATTLNAPKNASITSKLIIGKKMAKIKESKKSEEIVLSEATKQIASGKQISSVERIMRLQNNTPVGPRRMIDATPSEASTDYGDTTSSRWSTSESRDLDSFNLDTTDDWDDDEEKFFRDSYAEFDQIAETGNTNSSSQHSPATSDISEDGSRGRRSPKKSRQRPERAGSTVEGGSRSPSRSRAHLKGGPSGTSSPSVSSTNSPAHARRSSTQVSAEPAAVPPGQARPLGGGGMDVFSFILTAQPEQKKKKKGFFG